ncbi:hypothetical protein SAMN05660209_05025 [Geodermatophilus africanus]|uniref:Uncharacterized protein n=1 Tax=Geodermatophilus africanus TaxID=1137993 RepID=A0A1H3R5K4_9ACTN|nr:hypothetical protein SAMN05660209_05025 [Geodermatophilus africanus]
MAAERSRLLDATLLYVGTGPSPSNRRVLAFAEADRQRRVNLRTGRCDGAASRSRTVAADNGGTAADPLGHFLSLVSGPDQPGPNP